MQNMYHRLLGLPADIAVSELAFSGITDVQVVFTSAPPRKNPSSDDELRSNSGELNGCASTRVIAVQNDGHKLIVSRFLAGDPKPL